MPAKKAEATARQSLADRSSAERRRRCMLCEIPERQAIEEAYNKGTEVRDIVTWLVLDCGYDETEVKAQQRANRLSHHLRNHSKVT